MYTYIHKHNTIANQEAASAGYKWIIISLRFVFFWKQKSWVTIGISLFQTIPIPPPTLLCRLFLPGWQSCMLCPSFLPPCHIWQPLVCPSSCSICLPYLIAPPALLGYLSFCLACLSLMSACHVCTFGIYHTSLTSHPIPLSPAFVAVHLVCIQCIPSCWASNSPHPCPVFLFYGYTCLFCLPFLPGYPANPSQAALSVNFLCLLPIFCLSVFRCSLPVSRCSLPVS